ncbi:uncharacterized protein LOC134785278 [Penaeus indicus]|uniref:uncharacterized protein LOC134785278 n=1 Tax=Penaeus indicus TaxID=29960 RepID=UPI00300CFCF8
MAVLRRVQGIQELVGVCLERFMMATKYGGSILQRWLGSKSPLLPQQWIDIAIKITKIFRDIHSLDIIHNDIKSNNLCLEVTPDGIEVTLIDGGRCGSWSDIYGIGRLMKIFRRILPETPELIAWLQKSQSHRAGSREGLDVLLDALREERSIMRCRMGWPRL